MRALIFAGGESPGLSASELPDNEVTIAADSGLHHAAALGIVPDLIVGDLDSAAPDEVERAIGQGAEVLRWPAAKAETDLELALATAIERGATELTIVGALGGRVDHLLANVALAASARWASAAIELLDAGAAIWIVRGTQSLPVQPGATVTLLALGGIAVVTTSGMRWDLDAHRLVPGTSLGVSNEVVADAVVAVDGGVVAVIAPSEP